MLKNSNGSSLNGVAAEGHGPRRSILLTGPRVAIDPATEAVRPDLADIRLAGRVFAPHYAAPLAMTVAAETPLYIGTSEASGVVARLHAGDPFDALDFTHGFVWGRAPGSNRVGYVPRAQLRHIEGDAA